MDEQKFSFKLVKPIFGEEIITAVKAIIPRNNHVIQPSPASNQEFSIVIWYPEIGHSAKISIGVGDNTDDIIRRDSSYEKLWLVVSKEPNVTDGTFQAALENIGICIGNIHDAIQCALPA